MFCDGFHRSFVGGRGGNVKRKRIKTKVFPSLFLLDGDE